jgi:uncharacterized protein YukE
MEIHLTPDEIEKVAKSIDKQANNIDSNVKTADSQVNSIRYMKSPRLKKDIQSWDDLKKSINQAVEALLQASKELNKLAEQNRRVNQSNSEDL